jgi:phage minor structural protein
MISIYNRREIDFTSNGLAVLNECIKCVITEKLNGEYELEIEYPLNVEKALYIQIYNIVKVDGQLFRIVNINRDSKENKVTLLARHIFYDLIYYMVESKNISSAKCDATMATLISAMGLTNVFTVSSDLTSSNAIEVELKNGVEAFL